MTSSLTFNDGFHQTNFISSVDYIPAKYLPPSAGSALGNGIIDGLVQDFNVKEITNEITAAQAAAITSAFATFLTSAGSSIPGSGNVDDFFKLWRESRQVKELMVNVFGKTYGTCLANYYGSSDPEPFFYKSKLGMLEQLSIPASGNTADATSDFNIVTTATTPPPSPPITYPPAPDMTATFRAAFSNFLQNYPYYTTPDGTKTVIPIGATDPTYFFQQWLKFTATTVTLQIPTPPLLTDTNSSTLGKLPSYEEIYYTFHPGSTKADFQVAMVKFYNDQVSAKQFFLPSQSLGAWVIQNTNEYSRSVAGVGPFTLIPPDKAQILNRLIALLIKMISILQKVGVAQATTLKFVTSFQNVYVQLQTQIPVFSPGDKGPASYNTITSPIGRSTGDTGSNERQQLNTVLNSKITQTLQSYRGIQEDTAKQIQSRVNQTNDSVTQQTDMATAFLQQLSGLISAIFR